MNHTRLIIVFMRIIKLEIDAFFSYKLHIEQFYIHQMCVEQTVD